MSTCPPFEEFGPTSGPATATRTGDISANAFTRFAGTSINSAFVGGTFSVPMGARTVDVSVPLTGLTWIVQATVFLGYMEAEAGFDLFVLDPVSGLRAFTRTSLAYAIAPAVWGAGEVRGINIIPSLRLPVSALAFLGRRGTTWHAGLRLWARAAGFGGGGAGASVFCINPVPCINTVVS